MVRTGALLVLAWCCVLGATVSTCPNGKGTCPDGKGLGLTDAGITPSGEPIVFRPGAKTLYVDDARLTNHTPKGQIIFQGPGYLTDTKIKVQYRSSTFMLTFWMKTEYKTSGCSRETGCHWYRHGQHPMLTLGPSNYREPSHQSQPAGGLMFWFSHGNMHTSLVDRGTISLRPYNPRFPQPGRWHYYAILSTPTGGALWVDGLFVDSLSPSSAGVKEINNPYFHLCKSAPNAGARFANVEYHNDPVKITQIEGQDYFPPLAQIPRTMYSSDPEHSCKFPGAFYYTDLHRGSCFLMTTRSQSVCVTSESSNSTICTKGMLLGYHGGTMSAFSGTGYRHWLTGGILYFSMMHKVVRCTQSEVYAGESKQDTIKNAYQAGYASLVAAQEAQAAQNAYQKAAQEASAKQLQKVDKAAAAATSEKGQAAEKSKEAAEAKEGRTNHRLLLGVQYSAVQNEQKVPAKSERRCTVQKDVRCYVCTHSGHTRTNMVHATDPIKYSDRNCLGDPQKHAACASVLNSATLNLAKYGTSKIGWTLNNTAWKKRIAKVWLRSAENMALTD